MLGIDTYRNGMALVAAGILCFAATRVAAEQTNEHAADQPLWGDVPAWVSQTSGGTNAVGTDPGSGDGGVLRSMAALLVVLAALFAVHVFLRRHAGSWKMHPAVSLRILSRKRLGLRQELVVLEWEGERFLLGVGPGVMTRIHHCPVPEEQAAGTAEHVP